MGKLKIVGISVFATILVVFVAFFVTGLLKPKNAGIAIYSDPASSVFIDGEQVGRTPYESTRKPGEVVIKMIPDSFEKPLVPFEVKIYLVEGVRTVIQRDFAESEEKSSGVIVSFEKTSGSEISMAVVSIPDGARVFIDGSEKDVTPFKTSLVLEGEHQLMVRADGYKEKKITTRAYKGYKLTAVFDLTPTDKVIEEETKPPEEEEQQEIIKIEILSTPTGFLRVREESTTLSPEIGRVTPGEEYELLEEDEEGNWYRIKLDDDKDGWISSQYSQKIKLEEESEDEIRG